MMHSMKNLSIAAAVTDTGFKTTIDRKSIATSYPIGVWQSVPERQKDALSRTATYFATRHLAVAQKKTLEYRFPPPAARLMYDYGLFYSMSEAPYEFTDKNLTMESVMKSVYNAEFSVHFSGPVPPIEKLTVPPVKKNAVVMPISFGKDSLLTFAVCRELGFAIHPIFFEEPTCTYQNIKKRELRSSFNREFGVSVTPFVNSLGALRQAGSMMWGWDMLLLQYTTLLLPYVYHLAPQYFFWSNEQSTNEHATTRDGYRVNYTHEQSVQWVLGLTNLYRMFGINTTIASLLEPIHELVILSILHRRYPQIGKYQLSCDGEKTKHRWCGRCFECARVYLFFMALGIDPTSVGLMDNMFDRRKRSLFYLFSETREDVNIVFQSYPERLLAFYLAYKRGVRGGLMDEFQKRLLPIVEKQKHALFSKYLTVHESRSIPDVLRPRVHALYREEVAKLKKNLPL